jgi:polar amino acid transport system substrate-binding protein
MKYLFHPIRVLPVAVMAAVMGSVPSIAQTPASTQVLPSSHGPSIDAIRSKGTLTIGVSDDPPWSMNSAINLGPGIIPELEQEFARREGIAKVDIQPMPFSSFIGALSSGRIDIVADTMTPTAARAEIIDFPNPVVYNPGGLMVQTGNPRHLHQHADFNGGVRICVLEGSVYGQELQADIAKGQKIRVLNVPGLNECVNAVVSGQADAGIVDAVTAEFALKQNPSLGFEMVPDYKPVGDISRTISDIGFAKTEVDLKGAWNRDFDAMSKDGTVDKILQKYGLTPNIYVANPADPAYTKR